MKTWKITLTRDELIALAKVIDSFIEAMSSKGSMSLDELQTLRLSKDIVEKMPDEDWFDGEESV